MANMPSCLQILVCEKMMHNDLFKEALKMNAYINEDCFLF